MGKKGDLSDFERGMVVGARRAGLSISKTADLLGFSAAEDHTGCCSGQIRTAHGDYNLHRINKTRQ